ncbi:MAG TPA: hypothetical protein VMD30_10760, partial [Tepidisphaeraceae bacterium]|nr:hypothetical protein [Tepidisphaeraceae bacterium]
MRNDVKFGLTIGGLLVFILVIWIAVVNRGGKQAGTASSDVTVADGGNQASPAVSTPAPTPQVVSTPAPQPLVTTSTPS